MTAAKTPEDRALRAAWRKLERRRQAEDDQRRSALRQIQRGDRKQIFAAIRPAFAGVSRSQQRVVLRRLRDAIDLVQRRQRRDLDDTIRRDRREAAEADSKQMMAPWTDAERQALQPRTAEELIQRVRKEGMDALTSSAEARAIAQRIGDRGSDQQKRDLANAIAGIRRGRPKRGEDPRLLARMRLQKTEIQRKLVGVRRAWARAGADRARYAVTIERDVLIPVGLSPEKRRTLLPLISEPKMKPVDVASTIVGIKNHVPASVVRRLGKARLPAARMGAVDALAAQMGERQRGRNRRRL
jgi:hypothetical protein